MINKGINKQKLFKIGSSSFLVSSFFRDRQYVARVVDHSCSLFPTLHCQPPLHQPPFAGAPPRAEAPPCLHLPPQEAQSQALEVLHPALLQGRDFSLLFLIFIVFVF